MRCVQVVIFAQLSNMQKTFVVLCLKQFLTSLEFGVGRHVLAIVFALVLRKVGELHHAFLGALLVLVFLV